ncbi:SecD/SecF fusion protein [Thermonema lapsum]|uniref:Multifunctional fusion protein n=1 Tax=Thermonema lapsum TaxID=28195 RepID=A0A846MSJ4_9BACT|nr:protein translocase subunit SecDF [Thermonema lapsum]NIK74668.1 SecD/SecF fusion protein [Thermonema lapsum]
MSEKGAIKWLAIILGVLSVYYLSFTLVHYKVQSEAEAYATDKNGNIDFAQKQHYLDSVANVTVYNLGFRSFTYEEVQKRALSLGLDLQGGMHLVLEVSPADIVKALAGARAKTGDFEKALKLAQQKQQNSQAPFGTLFAEAYKEVKPDANLARLFANPGNKELTFNSSDEEVVAYLNKEINGAVDRAFEVLRRRIDKFGVANPAIQKLPTSGRIQVELPGVDDPERAKKLLSGVAKLEFYRVYPLTDLQYALLQLRDYLKIEDKAAQAEEKNPFEESNAKQKEEVSNPFEETSDSIAQAQTDSLKAADSLQAKQVQADSTKSDSLQIKRSRFDELFVLTGYGVYVSVEDTAEVNKILRDEMVRSFFPSNLRILWAAKPEAGVDNPLAGKLELYFIETRRDGKPLLEGDVIADARPDYDENGRPSVSMSMNAEGARKWAKITRENIGQRIAIVLDNYVYTAPTVQSEITGGNSSITGNFTVEEAADLANVLKAGKLPAPVRIVEEAVVGPSLGKESIRQGILSIVLGFILVLAFMAVYYGSSGWVANFALFINLLFIFGVLAPLGAVLTLPGIAGIVLTIGMAVDANVLIYERIREELKHGLPLVGAIEKGYTKALSSIIDANVTTFLTGLILYIFGSGPVQGFAIILLIGIVCSVFSSVFVSRLVVEYLAGDGKKPRINFITTFTRKVSEWLDSQNFDFIANRKKAYIFSSVVIVLGIVATLIMGGFNLGVDFKGGRSYVVEFDKAVSTQEVRAALAPVFENKAPEVKLFGANNRLKITTSYLIDDASDAADNTVREALEKGLNQFSEMNPKVLSSSKVGATIADDIRSTSQVAVVFSLIVIFLYILLRFRQWQYSLGAVVALFHDAFVVLSAYQLANLLGFSLEIDQVFIAAILTIIGYSINDTVVIFDRIREYRTEFGSMPLGVLLNKAINQTLSRTIITALTTFLVVFVLLLFGGEVLRGFAFALVVGVIFGTYSSVFIAAPIVYDFTKKNATKKAVDNA